MTKVIPYDISHLDTMDLSKDQESLEELKANTSYFTDAYTIEIDGKFIFSIGAFLINDQTANVWLIKSVHIEKYKIEVIKTVKMVIENYFKMYKLKRMQTLILNEKFKKWIELFGFELESELINYSSNKTYMYRRFK